MPVSDPPSEAEDCQCDSRSKLSFTPGRDRDIGRSGPACLVAYRDRAVREALCWDPDSCDVRVSGKAGRRNQRHPVYVRRRDDPHAMLAVVHVPGDVITPLRLLEAAPVCRDCTNVRRGDQFGARSWSLRGTTAEVAGDGVDEGCDEVAAGPMAGCAVPGAGLRRVTDGDGRHGVGGEVGRHDP